MSRLQHSSTDKRRVDTRQLARLVPLIFAHRVTIVMALIALAGGSAMNLAFPEVARRLINASGELVSLQSPWLVFFLLVGMCSFQAVCFYYRALLFNLLGIRIANQIRDELYANLLRQEIAFFDREKVGDLVSRLGADLTLLQSSVSVSLSVLIRYGFQVIAGVVMMLLLSWRLSLAIVVAVPVLVGFSMVLGKRLRALSKQQQSVLAESAALADETLAGIRVVKAFGRVEFEARRYASKIAELLGASTARTHVSSFFSSFVSFLMNICILGVLFLGLWFVQRGALSVGDLTAFMLYGVIVAVSFAFLAGTYTEFVQAAGASERVFELLGRRSEIHDGTEQLTAAATPLGVEFRDVSFAYPTRKDLSVLRNVSFSLRAGTSTALVGPSGSGKSTIVHLLHRFYDVDSGEILFCGSPLRSLQTSQYLPRMALVPQDAQVFSMSIADNLRYGKSDASREELLDVCRRANLLDFVSGLPNGLDTLVGERGTQVSGGQRQRLAIARAMLRNPDLLILDEATSALDSENEQQIADALKDLMKGRCTLVIAHRLSTVRGCDQVLVLEDGAIIQRGRHDELAQQPGMYKRLVERQELK